MKKKSKYFLSIGDKVVDFSKSEEFKGLHMEDFLTISLFTTLFQDERELLNTLMTLGIETSPKIKYDQIKIVKRKGTKKEGYTYTFVSNDILYKSGVDKLSSKSIGEFLIMIREKYDVILDLLKSYEGDLKRLEGIFKNKIARLVSRLDSASSNDELTEVEDQLSNKNETLKRVVDELTIIDRIKNQIMKLREQNCSNRREEELRYIQLLSMFVRTETYYKSNGKLYINTKGLFRLASRIDNILKAHPKFEFHNPFADYIKERQELLKALKDALQNECQLSFKDFVVDPEEFQSKESVPSENDPDEYMFLEDSDFERLHTDPTSKAKEDLKEELLSLEEKKRKHL